MRIIEGSGALHPKVAHQVLHASKKHEEALEMLNAAVCIDEKNPLAKFRRASVLIVVGRLQVAL